MSPQEPLALSLQGTVRGEEQQKTEFEGSPSFSE